MVRSPNHPYARQDPTHKAFFPTLYLIPTYKGSLGTYRVKNAKIFKNYYYLLFLFALVSFLFLELLFGDFRSAGLFV